MKTSANKVETAKGDYAIRLFEATEVSKKFRRRGI